MTEQNAAQESRLLIGWYVAQMIVRLVVTILCVLAFLFDPTQLDITAFPGLDFSSPATFFGSLRLYHVVAVFLLMDMFTKILPRSGISLGARKQFRRYHVPTAKTFEGGAAALAQHVTSIIKDGTFSRPETLRLAMKEAVTKARDELLDTLSALQEAKDDAVIGMRAIAKGRLALQGVGYQDGDLQASREMRNDLRMSHLKQVFPVGVIWVLFNALIASLLWGNDLLTPSACVLWCVLYFLSDMICVVVWCPFQVLFMKNRCCVTCHIFNWDAIMAVTPLIFCPCALSTVLVAFALVIFVLWEINFAVYPERFDERTNISLLCLGCDEKLCKWRGKCSGGRMTQPDPQETPR